MNRILGLFTLACLMTSNILAQSWIPQSERSLTLKGIQDFHPNRSVVAQVSDTVIKSILWTAPYENESKAIDSPAKLNLMMADGHTLSFGIVRYDMQESLLAAKFDNIRTFKGVCLSNNKMRVRLDYTVHGLRAVINGPGQHIYIEHYKRGQKDYKIIYNRNDFTTSEVFTCGVTEQKINDGHSAHEAIVRQGNCELNTFELATATTGEYSDFHTTNAGIPDEEEVHSAVVTSINRVNEVYEQDFGIRLILIDNNEQLYYYDGATDPYTNGSGVAMLGENQTNINNTIGNTNYDIGHVFSTGGGGVASLSSVCSTNNKARGVTGQSSPIGDPFSIDYVAHEMGHQFAGNHTQNNSCQRNGSTAMEPGSASTIMGYAGICTPNVQNNSDPYFHAITIQEVMNDASNFTCAEEIINFGNTSPNVVLNATSYTIPKSTTFVLDANGTDPDGDNLTFCWEQMDNQVATMPPVSTNTGGPAFRSLEPTLDSKRYFPALTDIIAGNSPEWEVLPSVGRDMDFRVTVRDWHDGPGTSDAGCTAEANVTITVDGNSGPFVVTSPITNVTWNVGESETITWDVSSTDIAPVNCNNVEIWFSEDNSFENPSLILTTANDGSANIIVPSTFTNTGKLMLKGQDNIFFDINEGEITIEESIPTFNITLQEPEFNLCNDVDQSINRLLISSVLGFDESVDLSIVSGLPAGASASFSNTTINAGEFSTINIFGFAGEEGVYDIVVQGVSGTIVKTISYQIRLSDMQPPAAVSPLTNAENIDLQPTLVWEGLVATSFDYQLSTGIEGNGIVQSGNVTQNEVNVTSALEESTTYYWRIKVNNDCGTSDWSDDFSFSTVTCQSYVSVDLPINILDDSVNSIFSSVDIYDRGTIIDLDVINLSGTHSWMNDLNFSLNSPSNDEMEFWDQPCGNNNDFNINFDDEASSSNFPCPPTDGNVYRPTNPLTFFDGKIVKGKWTLEILDDFAEDGGELESWGLKVCLENFCDLTVSNTNIAGLGSFMGAMECAIDGDTIRIMSDIANQTIDLPSSITLSKNISIIAEPSNNNIINFGNTNGGVIIANGSSVSLQGLTLQASGLLPTITNNGNLKLTDLNIFHPTNNQIINGTTATIEVKGICNIQE